MTTASAALDLMGRADAEPWDWTVATLPVFAARLGLGAPIPVTDGHVMEVAGGGALTAHLDRDGAPTHLSIPLLASDGVAAATVALATQLGPYTSSRRGETVTRWWTLPSGRTVRLTRTADSTGGSSLEVNLDRLGTPAPPWLAPELLADAGADLAVRLSDAGYVPVEDESLPDMAAALGGRLAWSGDGQPHRHIMLPGAPFLLELVNPVTSDLALTWYAELRLSLYGVADQPGLSRQVVYGRAIAALTRHWGDPTRPGPEATFWSRENGWTVAVDRSDGVVRLRLRTPAEPPVRPPE